MAVRGLCLRDVSVPIPSTNCSRSMNIELVDVLQKRAYGEIRSGIMLTLTVKLPKELCLLVFEFAVDAEDIPLDPQVWDMDSVGGMTVKGLVKDEYQCFVPANN